MLTHIVVWKYRADVELFAREEHVKLLRNLAGMIPRSYDTGLVATFADRAALDAYTVHPEHIKVAEFGRSISEHVVSVDFIG
jgi:hypothetical protein